MNKKKRFEGGLDWSGQAQDWPEGWPSLRCHPENMLNLMVFDRFLHTFCEKPPEMIKKTTVFIRVSGQDLAVCGKAVFPKEK